MSDAWKRFSLLSDLLELYKNEETQFKEYVSYLCERNYTVILFGSRARGDYKIYSDYDLLVIGEEMPKLPPTDAIELHFVKKEKLEDKIREFNTIVIDAFYEGKVICDKLNIYEDNKRKVLEKIKGLKRVKEGWVRENQH
ncbi:nucleotidyltransferase domain-containing protein [Sulfurisphaera tokodaii]|uniref:Nucleotidyltransferase domain-containing protein n=1 Tax=Sulfurisphaera tokodaii TaxID=111955 RepID=A0A832T3A0_9CREN|nr:nucleotidyltransferase domain-containing protein [Sulfurisphaera tokodaii]HII74487.1 nucleotidyltransferase domain-containing protein [Sulfurisphaera tokodaii]